MDLVWIVLEIFDVLALVITAAQYFPSFAFENFHLFKAVVTHIDYLIKDIFLFLCFYQRRLLILLIVVLSIRSALILIFSDEKALLIFLLSRLLRLHPWWLLRLHLW